MTRVFGMSRFVAFLRGVSPMNCQMLELKRCLEGAGFENVKTVLSSGNVAFDARARSVSALERKLESAMQKALSRSFYTVVRPQAELIELIEADAFGKFKVPHNAKRIVTFVRDSPKAKLKLPYEFEGVHIFAIKGTEIFSAYEPHPRGPVFMTLIERTFGKDLTTRTWDTVKKCAKA
jgi:uncharacterized protein (DUF1697 family)